MTLLLSLSFLIAWLSFFAVIGLLILYCWPRGSAKDRGQDYLKREEEKLS